MVYGRSIAIGVALLCIVAFLSALIFYLSLGPCPQGSFACDNGTVCVPQRQICDDRKNCADGSDEHPLDCGLLYGSKKMTNKLLGIAIAKHRSYAALNVSGQGELLVPRKICEITTYPKNCKCLRRTLYCDRKLPPTNLTSITAEVRNLMVFNNNLTLHGKTFVNITNLERLKLSQNNIFLSLDIFNALQHLNRLEMYNNNFSILPYGLFKGLHALEILDLKLNRLKKFPMDHLADMPKLEMLILSENLLTLRNDEFPKMHNIYEIYLDFNRIENIGERTFAQLDNLHLLNLDGNRIDHIHPRAFWGLRDIAEIRLVGNPIKELSADTFLRSKHLEALSLSNMPLHLRRNLLKPLNVSFLNLTGIHYERIDFDAINAIPNLKYIVYDRFYYCSMTPNVRMCKPKSDGISSFRDLLSKPVLRYSAWIMAVITIIGNILVLWGRFIYRDENSAVTMVIRNLALADILMGFYLVSIGVQDLRYRNEYYKVAMDWITSWQCTVVGTIAVSSSEVSMLILAFMSLERFLLIADPFRGHHRISVRIIFLALLSIWIMGVGIAVAPVVLWHSSTRFYGTYSGTCFPLHIQEPFPLGWQYSAFVFLGINLFLLLMIAVLYTALLISIWRTRRATPLSLLDCEFAVRFFFIVLTDVLCWAPIICVKIWVFFNYNISDDIYAWLVVFILPLNSAVNPLLYTFTTPKYRNQILLRGWKKITSRRRAEPATTTIATATGSSNPDDSTNKAIPLTVAHNH